MTVVKCRKPTTSVKQVDDIGNSKNVKVIGGKEIGGKWVANGDNQYRPFLFSPQCI